MNLRYFDTRYSLKRYLFKISPIPHPLKKNYPQIYFRSRLRKHPQVATERKKKEKEIYLVFFSSLISYEFGLFLFFFFFFWLCFFNVRVFQQKKKKCYNGITYLKLLSEFGKSFSYSRFIHFFQQAAFLSL